MIGKLISSFITIYKFMLTRRSLRTFYGNSLAGRGLEVGPFAICINKTGNKSNIIIGDNVSILGRIECQGQGKITIGDYTNIRYDSEIGCVNGITIGKYVIISHDVFIYDNNSHPTSPMKRKELSVSRFDEKRNAWTNADSKPVIVEDHVWIGFNCFIGKGVTVGKGSIVAAHSVVTRDVPPFSIVAGNPARVVKQIGNDLE